MTDLIEEHETKEKLLLMVASYQEKHIFKPGDFVKWKPLMQNKKLPMPAVVVEVLTEPIIDRLQTSGSLYFQEPLDLKLAHIDSDGDLSFIYADSGRFLPVV